MASNTWVIKCKTETGPYTLKDLTADSTVKDLKSCLQKLSQIRPEPMKILCGYPPKALGKDKDEPKLCEVNISSGDTIIIETLKIPEVASVCLIVDPGLPWGEMLIGQHGIMMRHVVPSDNSCLFNSVYFILYREDFDETKSNGIRQIIANAVQSNPEKYNSAILGMENLEYCAWILDSNHWGGAIELSILSEHFKLEIAVLCIASFRMYLFGEENNYTHRIFLTFDTIHYDSLYFAFENGKQTIFSVSDMKALDLAIKLVHEARSNRQLNDVAIMPSLCAVCLQKFCNKQNAMEHYYVTRHRKYIAPYLKDVFYAIGPQ